MALFGQHRIRRGVRALHFVVDNAFVAPGAFGAFRLHMPTFLPEDVLADARMKDGINVDVHQIVEILEIGAGHRVACFVWKGEGVQKCLQRPLEQLHKRFLDRVPVGTAQYGMLQNVRHPRGVFGRCAEGHAETFVFVVIDDGQQLRPRGVVTPDARPASRFVQLLFRQQRKAVLHG